MTNKTKMKFHFFTQLLVNSDLIRCICLNLDVRFYPCCHFFYLHPKYQDIIQQLMMVVLLKMTTSLIRVSLINQIIFSHMSF